jgi:SAM-dependent methyltransferase
LSAIARAEPPFYDPQPIAAQQGCSMARRARIAFSRPLHEPQLARDERRATGVYYTPPEIVRLIVDLTLEPLLGSDVRSATPPRILDPACGAGEFLVDAQRRLSERFGPMAAAKSVFGSDIDSRAIAIARQRLPDLDRINLLVGDALNCAALGDESFDVIVGNPPYVNIRQLAKTLSPERIAALRRRFRTARGNFDLYALFIERAIELLKPGGRCGLIVPNKWATLDYAQPCRELLLKATTVEQVIDLSESRAFAKASVYPHVLVFRKEPACATHLVRLDDQTVRQSALSAEAFALQPSLDVESRVQTVPLDQVAKISCGTAGYAAARVAKRLMDGNGADCVPHNGAADFITSGNIDRYAIRLGDVRFLNRTYCRPQLQLHVPELTAAKRKLFESPKIVIAGMSRRLEAAWDSAGLALGVQVFAVSDCQVDPFYLLALLNSKLLSYLFATRFAAKRLSGGYLAINKGQLAKLPIVVGTLRVPSLRRLSVLARRLTGQAGRLSYEDEIDRLVYRLYGLSAKEIRRVETHFAPATARAA